MRKNELKFLFIILIFENLIIYGFLFKIYIDSLIFTNEVTITDGILFITFLALLLYARETFYLRKEAQKQSQKTFTPYLMLEVGLGGLYLKNYGEGIACNIVFDSNFGQVDCLKISTIKPGGSERILTKEETGPRRPVLSYEIQALDNPILLSYSDLNNDKYLVSFIESMEYAERFTVKKWQRNKQ